MASHQIENNSNSFSEKKFENPSLIRVQIKVFDKFFRINPIYQPFKYMIIDLYYWETIVKNISTFSWIPLPLKPTSSTFLWHEALPIPRAVYPAYYIPLKDPTPDLRSNPTFAPDCIIILASYQITSSNLSICVLVCGGEGGDLRSFSVWRGDLRASVWGGDLCQVA